MPTVILTGATRGIGRAAAIELAQRGADVAVVGREPERVRETAREAGGAHEHVADLASLGEVRRLAAELLERHPRIDVLANNAGALFTSRHVTPDGFEQTFALNHLAPFLLTNLLRDRLKDSAPARVVIVSSHAHTGGRMDFDDLQGERSYSGARAYNQSKLANVLFSHELARRLAGTGVTANALHPGVVRTGFGAEDPAGTQRLFVPLLRPFMKSPARGAATSIHVASAPELAEVTGRYFVRRTPTRSSPRSYDQAVAGRLWQISAEPVGLSAAG
jgi:NAD(P)-dependent dehydrogenase (short-subunit alcohol dehydrogenase family)